MGHNSISALMKINSFVQYKKINKTIPQSFKGNKGYSECTHLHGMYNDLVTISKLLTTKDKMYWGRRMAMSIIWLGSILQWFCWLSDWCCAGDEPQSEDVGRGRGGCHVQGGRKCKNDTETGICVVWWVLIRSRVHTYLPIWRNAELGADEWLILWKSFGAKHAPVIWMTPQKTQTYRESKETTYSTLKCCT